MNSRHAKIIAAALISLLAFAYLSYRNQRKNDTTNSVATDIIGGTINLFGGGMKISDAGKAAIQHREGYENTVYADSGGRLTVGVGHLLMPADGYNLGEYVPETVIAAWFNSDISHAENIMARYITVSLTQNETDALGSAVFNLGARFFVNADGSKTQVLGDINAGRMAEAAAQFPRWDHVDGVVVAGLETRRISEMQQFLTA